MVRPGRCMFDVYVQHSLKMTQCLFVFAKDVAEENPEFDVSRNQSRIEFNLREVHRMSSSGVQLWCLFLEGLAGKEYAFRHASTTFTSQVAMIPNAAGTGTFLSFEAPYRCDTCDQDDIRLLEANALINLGRTDTS